VAERRRNLLWHRRNALRIVCNIRCDHAMRVFAHRANDGADETDGNGMIPTPHQRATWSSSHADTVGVVLPQDARSTWR
jgi:hypothetical protein